MFNEIMAGCLFMQVEKLKTDIESQLKEKEVLESRASKAEKRINELNAKQENVSFL